VQRNKRISERAASCEQLLQAAGAPLPESVQQEQEGLVITEGERAKLREEGFQGLAHEGQRLAVACPYGIDPDLANRLQHKRGKGVRGAGGEGASARAEGARGSRTVLAHLSVVVGFGKLLLVVAAVQLEVFREAHALQQHRQELWNVFPHVEAMGL